MSDAFPLIRHSRSWAARTSGLLLLLLLTACATSERAATGPQTGTETGTETAPAAKLSGDGLTAQATLQPTVHSQVSGYVVFRATDDGVMIQATLSGLTPGLHGFHIHEHGDCSAPNARSAGDHFAPMGSPHGPPSAAAGERHLGDLGNVQAAADGEVSMTRMDALIRLNGPRSIIGRAVVVHAGNDDLRSQPSGSAGARVACGVIVAAD